MSIGIKELRLDTLTLTLDPIKGELKPTGAYSIITTAGKAIATQTINGYGGEKITFSPSVVAAMDALRRAVIADLSIQFGLTPPPATTITPQAAPSNDPSF